MNPSANTSLIHYTKTITSLKKILKNGFRFSYCKEEYPKALINNIINKGDKVFVPNIICSNEKVNNAVLIPMVSFCDIPLLRSKIHSSNYGKFAIGIDKNLAREIYPSLTPVQYRSAERHILALIELSMIYANSPNLSKQVIDSLKLIIGTTKPFTIKHKNKDVVCYEEREWRVIHSDNDTTKWGWNINIDDVEKEKKLYNQRLHSDNELSYLSFIVAKTPEEMFYVEQYLPKLITHIIVKKDEDIPKIAEFILNEKNTIFGYNLSKESRLMLISKLNSFERISKDY
jgi:hypothetical protein